MSQTQTHAHQVAEKSARFAEAEKKRAAEPDRAVVDNQAERAKAAHPPAGREHHVAMANHLRERVESYLGSHRQEVDKLRAMLDEARKSEGAEDPAVEGILTVVEGHLNTASKT